MLWELLARTRQVMFKARTTEIKKYNISATKAYVLSAIADLGEHATPSEIARWHYREQHTISEVLTRMEKEGLVTKKRDSKKKSIVRINLTEKGRELEHKSNERYSVHRIISSLNKEERRQLRCYLEKLLYSSLKELQVSREIDSTSYGNFHTRSREL